MSQRLHKPGFTILELLISLALLAMMLTAVGTAIQASMKSYTENDQLAAVTQTARSVLMRMAGQVRTADDVDSTSTQLSIIPPDDGSGLQLIRYDFTGGVLYYRTTINGSVTSYELLTDTGQVTISSFNVLRETAVRDSQTVTTSVTVRMGLCVNGRTFNMTVSADPRRNQLL